MIASLMVIAGIDSGVSVVMMLLDQDFVRPLLYADFVSFCYFSTAHFVIIIVSIAVTEYMYVFVTRLS